MSRLATLAIEVYDFDGYNDVGILAMEGTSSAAFDWYSGGPSYLSSTMHSFPLSTAAHRVDAVGDINGDGFEDLYSPDSSTSCQFFGALSGFGSCVSAPRTYSPYFGDLNRDGYDDGVTQTSGFSGVSAELVNGSPSGWGTTTSGTFMPLTGDVFSVL